MIKLHKNIVLLSLFVSSAHAAQQRTYPLHEAVEQGIHRVRQLLLDKTIDVNLQNRYGDTALIIAAREGYTEIVALLLTLQEINVNLQNICGDTALILAVENGHIEIVQALLENKRIDVNLQNKYGDTAFVWALKSYRRGKQINIVQALLDDERIHINLQDNKGNTALINAVCYNYPETVQILLAYKPNNENQEKVNVNLQDEKGDTALINAVWRDYRETVKALLHHGADVNLLNKEGKTALSYSNKNFDQATLTHLVKNTQTPSLDTHHDLLQEDYLQSLFKQIYEGKCNQDLRQYTDILLVNKMLNSIKEDQKKIFYQACCDAYKSENKYELPKLLFNQAIKDSKDKPELVVMGYLKNMHLDLLKTINLNDISPIIGMYRWAPKQDTYAGFLQIANHTQDRFLFEVTKQAENHEAVATENLASALAQHKIVQDAEKVHNQPLSAIMPLLFAWLKLGRK